MTFAAVCLAGDNTPAADAHLAATVLRHSASPTDEIFAIAIETDSPQSETAQPRDHVVLIDTSASQVGEHRAHAFAVLRSFLGSLATGDRVSLVALDVVPHPLMVEFVPANDRAVTNALQKLEQRAPLGATNLKAGLEFASRRLEESHGGSILYIGDGMSTANLVQRDELRLLVEQLRGDRIAVHSYAVGPRVDLQLLGILGQQTGGVVLFDHADEQADDPANVGQRLAKAVDAPIFYPTQITVHPAEMSLVPQTPLPLRSDRKTVFLAQGTLHRDATIRASGERAGQQVTLTWDVSVKDVQQEYSVLGRAWREAVDLDGFSVAYAGMPLLREAQRRFDGEVDRMVAVGERAVAQRQLKQAEKIAFAVSHADPGNVGAEVILGAVNNVRALAQADEDAPPPADNPQAPENRGRDNPPDEDMIRLELSRQKVKGQQLQNEVEQTVELAREIGDVEFQASREILKQQLGALKVADDIDPDLRDGLIRRVRMELENLLAREDVLTLRKLNEEERLAHSEAKRRLVTQLSRDDEIMEQLIAKARGLMVEAFHGDDEAFEEAESVAEVAWNHSPGNAVVVAAFYWAEGAGQLRKANRLRALRADRFLETLYQVELSHVPFPDEPPVRYPPPEIWRALSERREKWKSVDLKKETEAERRIRAALSETVPRAEYIDDPLETVLQFLADEKNITIIPDRIEFEQEGISLEEPINLEVAGISFRSVLRLILDDLNLTYVIEDEVMKITTKEKARQKLSTRVYPVGDLVVQFTGSGGGATGATAGGGVNGGGGFGGGGQGGGQGLFGIPAEKMPGAVKASGKNNKKDAHPERPIGDRELQGILEDIVGEKTSRLETSSGQAFAHVADAFFADQMRLIKKKR